MAFIHENKGWPNLEWDAGAVALGLVRARHKQGLLLGRMRQLGFARIAQGITQRELAKRLGLHESQVSRDERNEYFGITLESRPAAGRAPRGGLARVAGQPAVCPPKLPEHDARIRPSFPPAR
jgi:hypothetical protein